MNYKIDS